MADKFLIERSDIRKTSPQFETTFCHQPDAGFISLEENAKQYAFTKMRRLSHGVPHERRADALTL